MAILASELRIGNLIYDDSNTPLPVEYIHRDVVGLKNSMGGTDKYQTDPIISGDINKLSPIPLTEEWLVRFGFEKWKGELHKDCWSKAAKFHIDFVDGKILLQNRYDGRLIVDFFNTLPHVKYVHQLQNLYHALTGEELKVRG